MNLNFKISIGVPPDREKLVAEIFYANQQIMELNQEGGALQVEIYPRQDGKRTSIIPVVAGSAVIAYSENEIITVPGAALILYGASFGLFSGSLYFNDHKRHWLRGGANLGLVFLHPLVGGPLGRNYLS